MKKRTDIDWSKHEVITSVAENGDNRTVVHWLKIPQSGYHNVKFINTNGIMAVTGDFGNWIFNREFIPSAKEHADDGYMLGKCDQKVREYDAVATESRIRNLIDGEIDEQGYSQENAHKLKEYFNEILEVVDNEKEYTFYAHELMPGFFDSEGIPFEKDITFWMKAVLDAYDEICKRLAV